MEKNMLCLGCGKEIPFLGDVCPYCQRDKSRDQIILVVLVFFAVLGGFVGSFFSFMGLIIGTAVGVVIGLILILSLWTLNHNEVLSRHNNHLTQPPVVRMASEKNSPPPPNNSIAEHLENLEYLKTKNLISQSEFDKLRKETLAKL
ncbi:MULTISPECIES: CvpA family protein [Thiorhodovibrio]|uniref:CvpA family protein n=1 Tax=Thiorhodovibrio TaxID=61593 RepID=UPI00191194B0|nr:MULTISPECIES: CvpA family protein [Thiorhodovibrio]